MLIREQSIFRGRMKFAKMGISTEKAVFTKEQKYSSRNHETSIATEGDSMARILVHQR